MKENDYEYLGDDVLHVLIPKEYPLELKLMVLAALKTYLLGNKSVDYMLKKYGDEWAEQFEVECAECGRNVRFRKEFDPDEDDFIIVCHQCGRFFCKDCIDWEHPVGGKDGEIVEVHCHGCREKKNIRGTAKLGGKARAAAQVIRLEDIRRKKH